MGNTGRILALTFCAANLLCGQYYKYPGLWLKLSDETVPAGGVVQLKLSLTEPKPIIRTNVMFDIDESTMREVVSVSLYAEDGDVAGVAVRRGAQIQVRATSPSGSFGNTAWAPMVVLTARVRPDAVAGTRVPIRVVGEQSEFYQRDGEKWTITSNEAGSLTVDGVLSIEDVIPGGGMVWGGQPVRIVGRGFQPWSKVTIDEAPTFTTQYVSGNELNVIPETAFRLDQREFRVVNPDKAETTYYTSLRAQPAGPSTFDYLSSVDPLFSERTYVSAVLDIPAAWSEDGYFAGFALQNSNGGAVAITFDLYDENGAKLISSSATLARHEKLVRNLDEIFPEFARPAHTALVVSASAPIQVIGLGGRTTVGGVEAILPQSLGQQN